MLGLSWMASERPSQLRQLRHEGGSGTAYEQGFWLRGRGTACGGETLSLVCYELEKAASSRGIS